MEPYWDLIERIIKESDLVLEILDARLVELSRNKRVEELAKEGGKPLIFVINKSDLVSKESVIKQADKLKEDGEVIFVSSKKRNSERLLYAVIRKVFKKYGKREIILRGRFDPKPKYKEARGGIVVGVLGYPNIGKSSIINLLSHKKKVKVSKKAGTTHGIHWIKATNEILLIDSPGVIPLEKSDEIRYGLLGAKDSGRLKDPELIAMSIIRLFLKDNKENFEKFYDIKIKSENPLDIIEQLAEKKHYLLKGGRLDENKAISLIIDDWQHGKLIL